MKQGYKLPAPHPCSMCGQTTKSMFPVCARKGPCRDEYNRLIFQVGYTPSPPKAERHHSCSLCGKPTTSEFEVCARVGKCEAEYERLHSRRRRGSDLSAPRRVRQPKPPRQPEPTRACTLCGRPTRSKRAVCARPGACATEYIRLHLQEARASDPRKAERLSRSHPCSMCGQPTVSELPMCSRKGGECATEYIRMKARLRRGSDLRPPREPRAPRESRPTHPCSLCDQPTTSEFPMCTRRNGRCNIEYQRLFRGDKDRRNTSVRRYRARRVREPQPSVYGVWFPVPRVLKVGFTTHKTNSPFVAAARTRASRHGWDAAGGSCIWRMPGDTRTEAWMQVTLASRWRPAFEQKFNRICEWFAVQDLKEEEIAALLNRIYGMVPADLTGDVPAADRQSAPEAPDGMLF